MADRYLTVLSARHDAHMRVAGCLVVLALAAACTSSVAPALVVTSSNPRPPYSGPLQIPVTAAAGDEHASVLARSGAAGRALECDGTPYNGGAGGVYIDDTDRVRATPTEVLAHWSIVNGAPEYRPAVGYRVERRTAHRVLFSWDVDDRTRFAVIVADGQTDYFHHTGWGIETWAQCDPAEFPAYLTDALGLEIWTDQAAHRVPIAKVVSYPGDWCDIDSTRLLYVGGEGPKTGYAYDPQHHLAHDIATTPYAEPHAVPTDAADTGFHRDGRELWTIPSNKVVYLVAQDDPTDVQAWPQLTASCGG